jgi:photosystem II stability/assembly factor-like uncharacterized protein
LHKLRVWSLLLLIFTSTLVIVAAAQTVSPDLYSGLKWRLIGPFRGGRAIAAAGIPGNPSTFYFGAVGGGIWKTTDAGVTWNPIFDTQHVASIGALAIAPSNPKVIYAGTGESDIRSDLSSGDGVYKSTDGGETWTNVGLRESRQISRIVVDPRDANIVYVAVLGHAYAANEERGVYKSQDGGANWTKVLDQGAEVGVADLAIATDAPDVLFATTWRTRRPPWSVYAPIDGPGSGMYRSQDGGKTWSRVSGNGLPDGDWGRVGVAVASDGKRVYALIATKKFGGLYRSDDGGNSWVFANADPRLTGRAWYFGNIEVDPRNRDVLYVPNVALYRSEDAGKTISVVRGAPGGDDYHQIWIDPQDSKRLVLATDQGTSISLNYGQTWSSWNNQPTAQMYHVTTDNQFPYTVYGTQQDSGSAAVLSRTDHAQITPRDWFPASGSESGYIAIDPNDPDILYVTSAFGGVSRFEKRISFSQDVTPWPLPTWGTDLWERKYRATWNPVLVFSPVDHKTLYLGTQYVMKTTDGGLHWEAISPDLTGAAQNPTVDKTPPTVENAQQRGLGTVFTIAPSTLNAKLIWAGSDTGLIHITRDGGKTWNNVTPKGLTGWSKISLIEASHSDAAEAYAAVDRHRLDDQKPYLYRTRDYGATWQPITTGIEAPAFLRAVREDPQQRGLLFAGTEGGVYASFDDGDHWQSLKLNLPAASIHDLVIHEDDLVIATHGRSFWILDDITPLRQAAEAQKTAGTWLYKPATAVRVDNDAFIGTPLPPEEPTAQNPPNGAIIDYYVKQPVHSVKLEIFDSQHTLVRRFSSHDQKVQKHPPLPIAERWFPKPEQLETNAGMHRFVWNLAWGSSGAQETSEVSEDDYLAPRGPRVIPGNYEVRLTIDDKSWTQPLRVIMDPRVQASPRDLQEQLRLGREIYEQTRPSRKAMAEADAVRAQLTELEQKIGSNNDALKTAVTQTQAQLADILKKKEEGPASAVMGLEKANTGLAASLRVVESGHRAAPAQAIALYQQSAEQVKLRIAEWNDFKKTRLPELNQKLQQVNLQPIAIAEIEQAIEYLMTR